MAFANIVKWISIGLDIADKGADIYGKVKIAEATAKAQQLPNNPNDSGGGSTMVINKTPEEIALEKERQEEAIRRQKENDAFMKTMIMNQYIDKTQRKKDHTTLFIATGLAITLIATAIIMKAKQSKNKKQ